MSEHTEIRKSVAALAVGVVALAAFALALGNDFAYDDVPIVLGDARLRTLDLRAIFSSGYWQSSELALYRPLTTLSFALDWALAPAAPAWFHLGNIVLHAGASVLAFLVLARLFPVTAALVGGLVFAVHPVHVEAVANVVGRAELLAAVATFAACLAWDGESRFRPLVVAAFFALALLAKESAVMLPALLLLVDVGRGERFREGVGPWIRRQAVPLLALAVVAAAYLLVRGHVLGGLMPGRVDPALELARDPGARILTALQAWPVFARLLFFPLTLLADYGPRILLPAEGVTVAAGSGLAIVAFTVLGGVTAIAIGARRTAFGLLWFPVAIFPASNLLVPIGVLVAERTLYVPSLAVAVAAAGMAALAARAGAPVRRASSVAAATVIALLAGRSLVRIPDWRTTDTVMAALMRDRPDSFRASWHAARLMRAGGDAVAAGAAYDRAIQLWPHRQALVIEAAALAIEQGRGERAVGLANLLVRNWPEDPTGYRLLGGVALDAGDLASARQAVSAGLEHAPGDPVLQQMAVALDSLRTEMR